ncbi:MAG: ferrous iron transport protein A [Bdellovibrionaceae bacterium]|nr:ferrous iron transport protein A [Pseudobdellovibrionaceae bacterium]
MNAWNLQQNQSGKIICFNESTKAIVKRLEDLGFTQGEIISCLKYSPFNGPRVYKNSHGIFSLEEEVAKLIEVQIL